MTLFKDWFLLGMIGGVVLASIAPDIGRSGGLLHLERISDWGIFAIFFLHGVGLSTERLKQGLARWPVHVVVQLFTFVIFPIIGLVRDIGGPAETTPLLLRRAIADPRSARPQEIVALQRRYGNQLVRRLIEIQRAGSDAPPATVRQGSQGADVSRLQDRLNELGSDLVADGIFGGKTRAAVVAFQSANGLAADGIVGPMTWNTLLAGGPEPVPDVPVGETKTPGTETHDADGQETPSEPTPEEKGGVGATVVSTALSQEGSVQAKAPGAPDPDTGKTTRLGWENLDKYFESSYGGRDGQYNSVMQSQVKFFGGQLQSWCGHFAVWAWKSAGVNPGNWKIGSGVGALMMARARNPKSYTPQPGDIGYIDQPFQHHCIVVRVEGDRIITIDGNTAGEGGATGGVIAQNNRPRSTYTAFFALEP